MKKLRDILYKVQLLEIIGNTDIAVSGITIDSRSVKDKNLFGAIVGEKSDGHQFIDSAISLGAVIIICEHFPEKIAAGITYVRVNNTNEAIAYIAHNFYDCPSENLKLVGVTGTNGKTTIATVLFKLFTQLGYKCGLISTIQNHIGDKIISSTHTTPDAVHLNALLREMADASCVYVFMECSSHAIHQHRITGLSFAGGLFSNITHDHLDYHKTFDEYIRVKKSFFDHLDSNAFAISNKDDKRGEVMLQNTKASPYYYSLKTTADFKGKILDNSLSGLQMLINNTEVHFRLIGEFNAYNLLAVYAAAICLHQNPEDVLTALSLITGAEGRFDYIMSNQRIIGIIDYAHTPDALENVLGTIRKLRKGHEQIITVVGCGGDRDRTKRPLMAQSACNLSDKVIFTSDNPRSENPDEIIQEMLSGLNSMAKRKFITITDRSEAIKMAVELAQKEDIILVAGKGHEKYQDIKGVKYEFDDKKVLGNMFELLKK